MPPSASDSSSYAARMTEPLSGLYHIIHFLSTPPTRDSPLAMSAELPNPPPLRIDSRPSEKTRRV